MNKIEKTIPFSTIGANDNEEAEFTKGDFIVLNNPTFLAANFLTRKNIGNTNVKIESFESPRENWVKVYFEDCGFDCSMNEYLETLLYKFKEIKSIPLVVVLQFLNSQMDSLASISKEKLYLKFDTFSSNCFYVNDGKEDFYLEVSYNVKNKSWGFHKMYNGRLTPNHRFFCIKS